MKTLVKDFFYRNEHYSIVYDGKFYMTVNHKYIDNSGKTIKVLHYSDGLHPAETMEDCIKYTKEDLDFKYYKGLGYSDAEALFTSIGYGSTLAQKFFD